MKRSSCHSGSLFEKEAAKRGWENLELVVLEDNLPRRSLNKKENEWYLTLKPLYNAVVPTPRRRWSEICEILKQRPEFIAWREKN